jgi:phospholipid/cholesterol/gamma-HCH transport system substrate-binding protein
VLIAVLALITAIVLAGHAQDWFVKTHRINIEFPSTGAVGLSKGAPVEILGYPAGLIEKIDVRDDGSMAGVLTVKGEFIRFVRVDSRAVIKKKFTVAGAPYIEITRGVGAKLPENHIFLCEQDTELIAEAQRILDAVSSSVLAALQKVNDLLAESVKVAAEINNPEGPVKSMLARIDRMLADLENGQGSVGLLLRDPAAAEDLRIMLTDVQTAIGDAQAIVTKVKEAADPAPAIVNNVNTISAQVPDLLGQAQATLKETERLIQGLQGVWPVRSHVPDRPDTTLPSSWAVTPATEESGHE